MRTTIRDPEVLSHLHPLEVAAYLRTRHWTQTKQLGTRGSVWAFTPAPERFEILLPLDPQLKDFVQRMGDVVRVLEAAEDRPQVEIITDIGRTTSDAVRIRAEGSAMPDGTMPVGLGTQMMIHAQELVLAAACAAVDKRPVYYTRKPTRAVEYMRHVRWAAPERGSFILTLLSPVPPTLTVQQPLLPSGEIPFERCVTVTLARALAATVGAASEASATGSADPFLESVNSGVHANLCEAIANLFFETEAARLTVRVGWAPTRPLETDVPSEASFAADVAPILQTAARMFRERAPITDFKLLGLVVELRRDDGATVGTVTILTLGDDVARKVKVELEGSDYDLAIQAHKEGRLFRCIGELAKEGRSFTLKNPREVSILTID